MQDADRSILPGIFDTPTVWLQLDPKRSSRRDVTSGIERIVAGRVEPKNIAALATLPLSSRLSRAFESESFNVAYQPTIDAVSGSICGMEALLRWKDPANEASSPSQFVPILEKTGLIVPLGEWILSQACAQAAKIQTVTAFPFTVSVNLAPQQFAQRNLVARVAKVLHDSKLSPHNLELEVTESILEDIGHAQRIVADLRDLGVSTLIDDFGIGYSSLNHLKRLPVAGLKLDRSFVAGIMTNRHDRLITQSIISLAKKLSLEIVAEGVEDQMHEQWLRERGVHRLQGFLYSPAVSSSQAMRLIRSQPFLRNESQAESSAPTVTRRRLRRSVVAKEAAKD